MKVNSSVENQQIKTPSENSNLNHNETKELKKQESFTSRSSHFMSIPKQEGGTSFSAGDMSAPSTTNFKVTFVKNTSGSFGICPKDESISTRGLLSCMPVVVFYKDGDIGLLHYNSQNHDDCIKSVNSFENKNIDKLVLYTCKEREKIESEVKEFYNFCSKLKIENYHINTSSAKSTKNLACLCSNYNDETFTITNNDEYNALLSFSTHEAEERNKKIFASFKEMMKNKKEYL